MNMYGVSEPEYKLMGNGFMVILRKNAFSTEKTVGKILEAIKENPRITQAELAKRVSLSRRGGGMEFSTTQSSRSYHSYWPCPWWLLASELICVL